MPERRETTTLTNPVLQRRFEVCQRTLRLRGAYASPMPEGVVCVGLGLGLGLEKFEKQQPLLSTKTIGRLIIS